MEGDCKCDHQTHNLYESSSSKENSWKIIHPLYCIDYIIYYIDYMVYNIVYTYGFFRKLSSTKMDLIWGPIYLKKERPYTTGTCISQEKLDLSRSELLGTNTMTTPTQMRPRTFLNKIFRRQISTSLFVLAAWITLAKYRSTSSVYVTHG